MAIAVDTIDCSSLAGADLRELSELCSESDVALDVEALTELAEAWVLLTVARDGETLVGFAFCTLERIGGTPCVLIGAGHVSRIDERSQVLKSMITDQMRRAGLSFPDEDVLFGAQVNGTGGFEAFSRFYDVIPRPGRKASGEDRAWGQRLAKRFGISLMRYKNRTFVTVAKKWPPTVLDHESLDDQYSTPEHAALLSTLVASEGDTLIVHGWVKSEELEKLV